MSTEKFNEVDDLRTHYMCAEVHPERDSVFIAGSSPYEPAFLNIAAARALYEWLGKALPYTPSEADHLWAFYRGVQHCVHDTWQCPDCGYSEPWWEGSNAEHLTRKAAAMLAEREKEPQK